MRTHNPALAAAAPPAASETDATYRIIAWRLLPFLFVAYIVNSIDRANVSFAKLKMAADIGLSDASYGLGASLFFLGYLLFEVPSNLYMHKVGARATITRIMVLWGAITAAMSLVTTPTQFYALRFLLGVAEAGFFPGVILYLTYWFPAARRGRITALFLMGSPVAGVLSGPLAGWIMGTFAGAHGLKDWQVLFVYEGIPAVLLGVLAWFVLADGPAHVSWLSARHKHILERDLHADAAGRAGAATAHGGLGRALRNPKVWIGGFVFFTIYAGLSAFAYWMPTAIRATGISNLGTIGWLTSLPYAVALVTMVLVGRSSDRRLERRWHAALAMVVAAAGFALLGLASHALLPFVLLLCVATAGSFAALAVFWAIPPALLSGPCAASGIALISSIGGLAAFLTPNLVGQIATRTGNLYLAFAAVAVLLVAGAVVLLTGIRAHALGERRQPLDETTA